METNIFKVRDIEHGTAKLFFDESGTVDIQRYESSKYPIFQKLLDKQQSFFWLPQEINMSKDAIDFKGFSEAQEHIFTSNLKRQILLDSVQGRAPCITFGQVVSDPALESLITWWQASEVIHSQSYTHIIRNVYPNPSKVFDEMKDIREIVELGDSVSVFYDDLLEKIRKLPYGDFETKRALYRCLLSVNALEQIRFHVSFACTYSFAQQGLMTGSAKIIQLIHNDECVAEGTEVLTPNGWKRIEEFDQEGGEMLAQFCPNTREVSFVNPSRMVKKKADMLIKFEDRDFHQMVTPNHRMLKRTATSKEDVYKFVEAKDIVMNTASYVPVAGYKLQGKELLSDLERFYIAAQADGSVSDRYTGEISGTRPVTFYFTKERKKVRMEALLDRLGFSYRKIPNPRKDEDGVLFRVDVPMAVFREDMKTFKWVDLSTVSSTWAEQFLEEVAEWDGHRSKKTTNGSFYYSSTDKENVKMVQAVAALCGRWASYGVQTDNRKESYRDVYRTTVRANHYERPTGKVKTEYVEYDGNVYCPTVPTGAFLIRSGGRVSVTGNCLHIGITTNLLKLLPKDDPDFERIAEEENQTAYDIYMDVHKQEKEWVKYLFSRGTMFGITQQELEQYLDWLVGGCMRRMGLDFPISIPKRQPLPWMRRYTDSRAEQVAPQESEITSYESGNVSLDIDNTEIDFDF